MDDRLRDLERRAAADPSLQEELTQARLRSGEVESIDAILAEREEVELEILCLEETFQEEGEPVFRAFVDAVFREHPALPQVQLLGYTPGFMDGDVCEHEYDVYVGRTREDRWRPTEGLTPEAREAIHAAFMSFRELLESLHGTDWELLIDRGEAGPTITKSSYCCGY